MTDSSRFKIITYVCVCVYRHVKAFNAYRAGVKFATVCVNIGIVLCKTSDSHDHESVSVVYGHVSRFLWERKSNRAKRFRQPPDRERRRDDKRD